MAEVTMEHHDKFSGLMEEHFNNPEYCSVRVIADDGTQFHCAEYALRCGSEVFHKMLSHNMQEKVCGEIHIRDAASDALRIMLSFMHSGKCCLCPTSLLPVTSIALRYQVHHLISACEEYREKHFLVDEANWSCVLNQVYTFCEVPQGLKKQCQRVVLSNLAGFTRNKEVYNQFLQLPYQLVEDITKAALCYTFLNGCFQTGYVTYSLDLLEWLDHDIESRSSKALSLLSCLRFDALGFEGIARICDRESSKTNWVRKHPELEQRILDALPKVIKVSSCPKDAQSFTCAPGRWYFICKTGAKAIMATFDFEQSVHLHTYFNGRTITSNCIQGFGFQHQARGGSRGCAILTCCSRYVQHILLAAGSGMEKAVRNSGYCSQINHCNSTVLKEQCVFGCDVRSSQETCSPVETASRRCNVDNTIVHPLAAEVERAEKSFCGDFVSVLREPGTDAR